MIHDLENLVQYSKPAYMSSEAWNSFTNMAKKIISVQEQLFPILEGDVSQECLEESVDLLTDELLVLSEEIDDFFALSDEDSEDDETRSPALNDISEF